MSDSEKNEKAEKKSAPAAAVKRTVEEWATDKGMLPQFFAGKPNRVTADGALLFGTAKRPNRNHAEFAGARGLRGWVEGAEVTEAEFDAAVTEAAGVAVR